jgi:hypothetical protein
MFFVEKTNLSDHDTNSAIGALLAMMKSAQFCVENLKMKKKKGQKKFDLPEQGFEPWIF